MRLFDKTELMSRIERFANSISKFDIDTALITSNMDLFYFTGSVQKGTLVINSSGESSYFVKKNFERAKNESALEVRPWNAGDIKEKMKGVWAVPMDVTTLAEHLFLKNKLCLSVDAADCSLPLALTKMVKSDVETDFMKKAAKINIDVMEFTKKAFRQGMTDIHIQAEIESYAKRELGHQGLFWVRGANMEASMGLVVTGSAALTPTYTDFPIGGEGLSPAVAQGASGKYIQDSFVVDFIGSSYGYCADSTRTFFIGRPDEKIVRTYNELNDLLSMIVKKTVPGITGEEVYNFAMEHVAKQSWKDNFMGYHQKVKFISHGIGTEVNQLPVMAPRQKIPYENGMCIAIEPKIFLPDYGVIGIENTYLMKNGHLESLTGCCQDLEDFIIKRQD